MKRSNSQTTTVSLPVKKQKLDPKQDELFFVVGSNGMQFQKPNARRVYVVPIRSTLYQNDVNAAIKSNTYMDKQRILGLPKGVVADWDYHPEVACHSLSDFDQAVTITLNNKSNMTRRKYFHGALTDIMDEGYALKNSVQDSVVHGGPVGLFLMKTTTTNNREVQRKMLLDVVRCICEQ